MARTFRQTGLRRLGNTMLTPLIKLGLAPKGLHLLSVSGRKSGRTYTTPVNLVFRDGQRYLVSPYRRDGWASNARAAGEVTLSRGGRSQRLRIKGLGPAEAAPVLKQYLRENPITGPYFEAGPGADESDFAAEAHRHPVFRLSRGG